MVLRDCERDLASLACEGSIFGGSAAAKLERLQVKLGPLNCRYDVVVANPPYMGSSNMNGWVSKWVKKNYPIAKSDLCTCFFNRAQQLAKDDGYISMITASSWMFISSFEKFRKELLSKGSICSMIQQSTHGYAGVTVPTTMFTYACHRMGVIGSYIRLEDFDRPQWQEPRALEALANPECGWFYRADADGFGAIPGSPIAYWASDKLHKAFLEGIPLQNVSAPKKGLGTGNKDLFMRFWWEPSMPNICFDSDSRKDALASNCRWFPHNKGGEYRKWYGNCDYVVDWLDDGSAIKQYTNEAGGLAGYARNQDCYFKQCITWSKISSGKLAFRFKEEGDIFNEVAPALFGEKALLIKLEAFLNSSVCDAIAAILSPTLDFQVGQVASYPILEGVLENNRASNIVELNTGLSRQDWNSFEESWSFCRHPLV